MPSSNIQHVQMSQQLITWASYGVIKIRFQRCHPTWFFFINWNSEMKHIRLIAAKKIVCCFEKIAGQNVQKKYQKRDFEIEFSNTVYSVLFCFVQINYCWKATVEDVSTVEEVHTFLLSVFREFKNMFFAQKQFYQPEKTSWRDRQSFSEMKKRRRVSRWGRKYRLQ